MPLPGSTIRFVWPGLLGCALAVQFCSCSTAPVVADLAVSTVGASTNGTAVLPVHQVLTPAGRQVPLPGLRPQVLALSPDGQLLVTSGKTSELLVLDPKSGAILQRVPMPAERTPEGPAEPVSTHELKPDTKAQVSYTGLVFSGDGKRLYISNVNGSVKVFAISQGHRLQPLDSFPLPATGLKQRSSEIPAGLALSPDGRLLYVAGNLSNRLFVLDAHSGQVLETFPTGTAPYGVVLAGQKLYVSNWGGRLPTQESVTGPAGRGTVVRVDPVRFIASEGSVTVVDLAGHRVVKEIVVGLHASAMALNPQQTRLVVANAGEDTLSVIDTGSDAVTATLSLGWTKNEPMGATPNALAFGGGGRELYVANGTQNAVAKLRFADGKSVLEGLIPVGWFPAGLVLDEARGSLYVANLKGMGPGKAATAAAPVSFNSKQYQGSLSLVPLPHRRELARQTAQVQANYQRARALESLRPPRPGVAAQPVPERSGEPSVFKHVIYIIKENRTYDQVLGDMPEGRGAAGLCIFGEEVTPNQHKMAREFVLLDNTYCSGILSADGHQWSDSAFANDYMEKSFAGFPRSYPDGMEDSDVDALAYSSSGFIWDMAKKHGKTIRDYGEFTIGSAQWKDRTKTAKPHWLEVYRDFTEGTGRIELQSRPAIASLEGLINTNTVGWDMSVPDVVRAERFIEDLRRYEKEGTLPELILICLPNDHTSGTKPGEPTPASHVADNDLAFGRIVEAVSHSRFWTNTCIFAIEDDPQDGWDHVSGYRTTAYVISPYTRRQTVVHDFYTQPSLLRTMELMLGLPPMNQMDASAIPMTACFTPVPDWTPFTAVPNRVPLDQLNPQPRAIHDPQLRRDALVSAKLPLDKVDQCPEDTLNQILWRARKGSQAPYPAWAILPSWARVDEDD